MLFQNKHGNNSGPNHIPLVIFTNISVVPYICVFCVLKDHVCLGNSGDCALYKNYRPYEQSFDPFTVP